MELTSDHYIEQSLYNCVSLLKFRLFITLISIQMGHSCKTGYKSMRTSTGVPLSHGKRMTLKDQELWEISSNSGSYKLSVTAIRCPRFFLTVILRSRNANRIRSLSEIQVEIPVRDPAKRYHDRKNGRPKQKQGRDAPLRAVHQQDDKPNCSHAQRIVLFLTKSDFD